MIFEIGTVVRVEDWLIGNHESALWEFVKEHSPCGIVDWKIEYRSLEDATFIHADVKIPADDPDLVCLRKDMFKAFHETCQVW